MSIPSTVYFCWIGAKIPWAYVFAILSAAERSGLAEVILYHTDVLEAGDEVNALERAPRVLLSRIAPAGYLSQIGRKIGLGDELAMLYRRLPTPVMCSDVLRAAILYDRGGIYLDLDTLTVSSLLPLIDSPQFVGTELIIWPDFVRASRTPSLWARQLALDLARKASRRLPEGWKLFRKLERFCFPSINNAVMGAEAHARLISDYLHAMIRMTPERQVKRYALGPHLLQAVVSGSGQYDLVIQEPRVFYPLPPEISEHWFRMVRQVALGDVLSPETRVVHWYASVRTRSLVEQITPSYVMKNRDRQLYSALVYSCIGKPPGAV